jgi:hypothetical protein
MDPSPPKKLKKEGDDGTYTPVVLADDTPPQPENLLEPVDLQTLVFTLREDLIRKGEDFEEFKRKSNADLEEFKKKSNARTSALEEFKKKSGDITSALVNRLGGIAVVFGPITKVALLETAVYQYVKLPGGVDARL